MNKPLPSGDDLFKRDASLTFRVVEDTYHFTALDGNVALQIDRLHRERGHLIGEITARTSLAGARTFGADGTTLFSTRINLMFNRDKREVADACRLAANTSPKDVRWPDYIEDFCQRVIATEKAGKPLRWIHEVPRRSTVDRLITVHGLPVLLDHPQILFGESMTGKSFLAAAIIGALGRQGIRTLLLDWEMDESVHRERFDAMGLPPTFAHKQCDAPLTVIAEEVKARCIEEQIGFVMVDSISHACDGPPEDAVVAKSFSSALRRIGRGSLSIAHTRAEDDKTARAPERQRPFGSVIWHTNARYTWFAKRVNPGGSLDIIDGIYNPKWSYTRQTPPFGLRVAITQRPDGSLDYVEVRPTALTDEPELVATLHIKDRLKVALAHGPRLLHELADELGNDVESLRTTLKRGTKGDRPLFVLVKGADGTDRWGRCEPNR